jgi:fido (protein-threonine AMPylation protein)
LREIWVTELPPNDDVETEEISMILLESSQKPEGITDVQWKRLKNIYEAMKLVGITRNSNIAVVDKLTLETVIAVHRAIGEDDIPSPGNLRTTQVGAKSTGVLYLPHLKITSRLEALLKFTNTTLSDISSLSSQKEKLSSTLKLAALFFSEFLFIHPFIDGNGRTARILLNLVISEVSVVPVSIFLNANREVYLRLLMEAQQMQNFDGLACLLLLCYRRACNYTSYLMLEESDEDDSDEKCTYCQEICNIS